jgi:predicted nucleic-acid-binding Zn-ribbon protein
MRESCVCPKCHHNRILQIAAVPDADGDNGTRNLHIAVTFAGRGWLGGDQTTTAGTLSASVCRRCGYTELYTDSPATIPIDGRYVKELVGPEPEGPYR